MSRVPSSTLLPQLVLVLVLASAVPPAWAGDIHIGMARDRIHNEMLVIDADATFEFSADAVDALDSGIPLTITLEIKVSRPRRYLWDPEVVYALRSYSIEHHALSKQFVVADNVTGSRRVHASLDLALADLGHIRDVPVTDRSSLGELPLAYALRLRLDLKALPGPLIPVAYVSPSWRTSSGWYRWQTQR
jgi:hypothetical protein